jgi:hypothetical protein
MSLYRFSFVRAEGATMMLVVAPVGTLTEPAGIGLAATAIPETATAEEQQNDKDDDNERGGGHFPNPSPPRTSLDGGPNRGVHRAKQERCQRYSDRYLL